MSHNADFKRRRLRAVQEDVNSSARILARKALEDLIDYALACDAADAGELIVELDDLALQLAQARPSRVVVSNVLERWRCVLPALADQTLPEARQLARQLAEQVIDELEQANRQLVNLCINEIRPGMTLMTHSCSSSVMALFAACHADQIPVQAIITESRPGMEGRRLARFLQKLDIPTQFITDAQMALSVLEADKVIIGADSLLRDGSAVTKAGSHLLALAARDAGIPLWVLADRFKHSRIPPESIQLEEMPVDEIEFDIGAPVSFRNAYFDLLPSRLIAAWVDEREVRVTFRSLSEQPQEPLLALPSS